MLSNFFKPRKADTFQTLQEALDTDTILKRAGLKTDIPELSRVADTIIVQTEHMLTTGTPSSWEKERRKDATVKLKEVLIESGMPEQEAAALSKQAAALIVTAVTQHYSPIIPIADTQKRDAIKRLL